MRKTEQDICPVPFFYIDYYGKVWYNLFRKDVNDSSQFIYRDKGTS